MQNIQNVYFKYFAMLIAGGIAIFAFAPFNYTSIIIFSVLLLLIVINNQGNSISKWQALGLGYTYSMAYFNTQLYWIFYSVYYVIHAKFFVGVIAQIGFTLFLASYIAFAILSYIKLKTKYELFNLLFLFPSIWVGFEWFRGWFLGGFSWCDIGYTVVNYPFFRGIFPILGEYGVSWVLLSFIAAAFFVFKHSLFNLIFGNSKNMDSHIREDDIVNKRMVRVTLMYCLVLMLFATFTETIQYTEPYGKLTSVALIQGNIPADTKWEDTKNLKVYADFIKKTKADIVILPETAISQFAMNLPEHYLEGIIKDAKANNASLIVGMPKLIDKEYNYINAAILLTSPKQPYYAKAHLVPYGEYIPAKWLLGRLYAFVSLPMVDFTAGSGSQTPLVAANQKLAFNICYENGFASELIKAAENSTLLVNLSDMVWYGKSIAMYQHLELSQARAIENQRYFIQATNTSITAIINPEGQIQSQLPIFTRGVLRDYVQGKVGQTPFEIVGNWLIISLCLFIIICAFIIRRIRT